ncbi:Bacteriophage lambda head decoration protein D [Methylobacterium sp. 174MFSha1.1]|uniref:head decoration protein n=1 Tax=Methylobacterium sp. 174MFSha1.1 TaxID=1502749 RepID=UPI0008E8690A|nr:head decoration protein [Methylobacterium sp. 174MFSha1.1]SFV06057.1 Bacteriophage lambda head decoration protein D [Methylobacterium sp. 174MFSha1.1]
MALLETAIVASDWLKSEDGSYRSRDTAIIASGSGKLVSGAVLAKVTATGKYVPAAASGADGSQTAVAVLLFPVDATSADAKAVIVSRHAVASHAGLTYGATINDATKRAAANAQLAAVGIIVRQGA